MIQNRAVRLVVCFWPVANQREPNGSFFIWVFAHLHVVVAEAFAELVWAEL